MTSRSEVEMERGAAQRVVQAMTEEQRRALLDAARGTLAVEGLHLDPEDERIILAVLRGDLTDDEFLALARRDGTLK